MFGNNSFQDLRLYAQNACSLGCVRAKWNASIGQHTAISCKLIDHMCNQNTIIIMWVPHIYLSIQYDIKIIVAVANLKKSGFLFKGHYSTKFLKGTDLFLCQKRKSRISHYMWIFKCLKLYYQ